MFKKIKSRLKRIICNIFHLKICDCSSGSKAGQWRGFLMAKLCAKGKEAAKRKFKVYPSAYANMYAGAVCSGKVTPGGKKADGGMINKVSQKRKAVSNYNQGGIAKGCGGVMENRRKVTKRA